jgi:ubiquinone biosynthesis protein COQ9
MNDGMKNDLLDAALVHVPFDGWNEAMVIAAAQDVGATSDQVAALFPRGAIDMAAAFHKRGDHLMLDRLDSADLATMRYSERVAAAVRFRLEVVENKDVVRRGSALFSLPQHAPEGAQLIWGTADQIWLALGDTSDDINWYSKRAILSGVYASSVLFWLGDNSLDQAATWAFVDRRIADVMRFEQAKAKARDNPVLKSLLSIPNSLFGQIRAPSRRPRDDLPGTWAGNVKDKI